jgi:hypothetical protein
MTDTHDPLCAFPVTLSAELTCVGCWLVELRPDAAYGEPAEREKAIATLRQLIASAQAHLDSGPRAG